MHPTITNNQLLRKTQNQAAPASLGSGKASIISSPSNTRISYSYTAAFPSFGEIPHKTVTLFVVSLPLAQTVPSSIVTFLVISNANVPVMRSPLDFTFVNLASRKEKTILAPVPSPGACPSIADSCNVHQAGAKFPR